MAWKRKRTAWFAVKQGFDGGPRFAQLNELETLWFVLAVQHAAMNQTDGVVPERIARRLVEFDAWTWEGDPQSWATARARLLASGLVEEADGALVLHDYLDHNPPREHVAAAHEERVATGKKGAQKRWEKAGDSSSHSSSYSSSDSSSHSSSNGYPIAEVEVDLEVRSSNSRGSQAAPPDAVKAKKEPRGSRLPEGWQPSAELLAAARAAVPSVDLALETDQFRDWAAAASGAVAVKRDWDAAWRTWMRRRHAENVERGWKPSAAPPVAAARAEERARQEAWLAARGITLAEWDRHERAEDGAWMDRVRAMQPLEGRR